MSGMSRSKEFETENRKRTVFLNTRLRVLAQDFQKIKKRRMNSVCTIPLMNRYGSNVENYILFKSKFRRI